ncbi:MAG: flavodoxin domain-containing protein, partial [Thermoproteota archaeon]
SHGPVHRKPQLILSAYHEWASGETKEKVTIVYVTMWNSTEEMIKPMAETLASEGIEVALYNLVSSNIGDIAKDLVDSKAIVLGTPTVLSGAHPLAVYAAYLVKVLKPLLKFGVILSSYGWSGGAVKHIQELLEGTRIEVVGTLEINGPPIDKDIAQIVDLGKTLARKIKEEK